MSILAELDTSLQALLALKAPGVTKSRISAITTLCVENVKSESVLVQKIFTHFKRAPGSHKLGVLYVIDAVTRQWLDKSGMTSQEIATSPTQDGTFAAGVHKVTELLPVMMNDLATSAPYDQKDKIVKLVDIWERGSIFPAETIKNFKSKLEARQPGAGEASTSTPPTKSEPFPSQSQSQSQSTSSTTDLLSSLAGLNPAPPVPPPAPVQQAAPPQAAAPALTPDQLQALSAFIPPHVSSDPVALQQHLQILQQLVSMGVPPAQWNAVMDAMKGSAQAAAPPPAQQSYSQARQRSRSPIQDSPGRYGDSYRQRSPGRSNGFDSNKAKWTEYDASIPDGCIKVLSRTLFIGGTQCNEQELRDIFSPYGEVQTCIPNPDKRHAFIKYVERAGAVNAKENMASITEPGLVGKVRSVRWGVGFGPRDCNDYTTGISIIPIDRLTEADRKWVLTAPVGGSGGKAIESGLAMEEPDIEIGAGVSSKAISRRVAGGEGRSRPGPYDRPGRGGPHRRSPPPQMPPPMPYGMPGYDARMPPPIPGYGMPPAPIYGYPGPGHVPYG